MPDDLQVLREAYNAEAPFHNWPSTFEAAIALPLVLALLRTYARHPEAMRSRRLPVTRNWHKGLHPAPTQAPAVQRAPILDRKRLAANDRDDD